MRTVNCALLMENDKQMMEWFQSIMTAFDEFCNNLFFFRFLPFQNADAVPAKAETGAGAEALRNTGQPWSGPVGQPNRKWENSNWKWKSKRKVHNRRRH